MKGYKFCRNVKLLGLFERKVTRLVNMDNYKHSRQENLHYFGIVKVKVLFNWKVSRCVEIESYQACMNGKLQDM